MAKNTIDIEGKEYPVKFGFRSSIKFEKLTGLNANNTDISTLDTEQMAMYMYAAVFAGATRAKVEDIIDFEGFLDAVEDRPELLTELTEVLLDFLKPSEVKKK